MGLVSAGWGSGCAPVRCGAARWVAAAVVVGVVVSSCAAGDREADLACGVFDPAEVERALGVEGVVFEGAREVRDDPPEWECVVELPSGSRLGLSLMTREQAAGAFTQMLEIAAAVSVGLGPGMVARGWNGDIHAVAGYYHLSCTYRRAAKLELAVVPDSDVSRVEDGDFDLRQLGTVLSMAARGIDAALRCGIGPPLSDALPSGPPERVPLDYQRGVCGVFDAGELFDVLPGGRFGGPEWFVWESPVLRDPVSCQVWREPTDEDTRSLGDEFLLGPGLAFSRRGAARWYDVEGSRERFGGVAWGEHLGGEGYAAEGEYRLKVQCNAIDFDVYVGRYSPEVIEREEFVALFERWIRGHAGSFCPVAEQ